MKYLFALLCLLAPVIVSCVTPQDLTDIDNAMQRLQRTVQDQYATQEEVDAAFGQARADLAQVESNVETRTKGFIQQASTPEGILTLGLTALLGGFGTNRYRNMRRAARGEAV